MRLKNIVFSFCAFFFFALNSSAAVAPVAKNVRITCVKNHTVLISPRVDDSDSPSWASLTVVSAPSHGTASASSWNAGAPAILYTPTTNYTGTDSLTYTVSDGTVSNVATVSIRVLEANSRSNQKVVLIANALVQPEIQTEITRLQTDLQNEGYTVVFHTFTGSTGLDLWNLLVSEYDAGANAMAGAILIGHLPIPINTVTSELTDHVYWNMGEYECTVGQHIWVSRICASSSGGGDMWAGGEAELLKRALNANHEFRTGISRHKNSAYHVDQVGGRTDVMYTNTLLDFCATSEYMNPRDAWYKGGAYLNETSHGQTYDYDEGKVSTWKIHDILALSRYSNITSCSSGAIGGVVNQQIVTRGGSNVYSVGATTTAYVGAFEVTDTTATSTDGRYRALLAAGDSFGHALLSHYAYADYVRPIFFGDLSMPLHFFPSNATPTVSALSGSPSSGVSPLTVNFTATASDSDGTLSLHEWFPEGHNYGKWEPIRSGSGAPTPLTHTFLLPHRYMARVEVMDNYKSRAYREVEIRVAPEPGKPFRVNCGTDLHKRAWQTYTPELDSVDSTGKLWLHDQRWSSGTWGWTKGADYLYERMTGEVSNTNASKIFTSWRVTDGTNDIEYTIPLANGNYNLTLCFADLQSTAAGQRLIDVSVNGSVWLNNYDIFTAAGGAWKAVTPSMTVSVTSGSLLLLVQKDSTSVSQAILNGFIVEPVGATNTAPSFVSTPSNVDIPSGSACPPIPFVVTDAETDDHALLVTAVSDNPSLIPNSAILLETGTGGNRTITITPSAGVVGSAMITLRVTDGDLTSEVSFAVTVHSSFTLTAPNGGQTFIGTQKAAVTWTSSVSGGNVRIDINTGSGWTTLVPATPNDGACWASLPNTASTNCRLRVALPLSDTPNDISDTTFTIVALADADGDGMHGAWETSNSLNAANLADADDDPDSDGAPNLMEFIYGTNPQSGASKPNAGMRPPVVTTYGVSLQQGLDSYAGCDDAYVNILNGTGTNSGTIYVRYWGGGTSEDAEGLLKFDLSGRVPAGATITSASLKVWCTRGNSCNDTDTVVVNKVTSAWTEAVNGSTFPTSFPTGLTTPDLGSFTPNGTYDPPRPYVIDGLSGIVQDWVDSPSTNYGLHIFGRTDFNFDFASSEDSRQAYRPLLLIEYETIGAPAANIPPVLSAPALNATRTLSIGQATTFSATATDADDSAGTLIYAWDVDASDGLTFSDGSGATLNYSGYSTAVTRLAVVRVTDPIGGEDYATVVVTVTGSGTTYTINASAGAGGSISPSGAVVVSEGSNQTFTITPNAGYHIVNVLLDGTTSLGAVTSYTFNNVTATHSIAASFAINTYSITVTQGANGSITPGTTTVNHGGNQTFTITPNAGYQVANVLVDGVSVGAVTSYAFTNVTSNRTITASYSLITYTVTGSVSVTGDTSSINGATLRLMNGPTEAGSCVVSGGIYSLSVPAGTYTYSLTLTDYTLTVTTPSGSITVSGAKTENIIVNAVSTVTWTITASAGANGSISPSGAVVVSNSGNQTFTITPNAGYQVANVLVDGVSVGAVTSYAFTNVTSNRTIAASYSLVTYAINGTIAVTGATSSINGATLRLMNGTTEIASCIISGGNYSLNVPAGTYTYSLTMSGYTLAVTTPASGSITVAGAQTLNITVNAVTATTWTITASAGAGGSISPSGAVVVVQGGNQTFTIIADAGFVIDALTVDGVPVVAAAGQASYAQTLTSVSANGVIQATFTLSSVSPKKTNKTSCSMETRTETRSSYGFGMIALIGIGCLLRRRGFAG